MNQLCIVITDENGGNPISLSPPAAVHMHWDPPRSAFPIIQHIDDQISSVFLTLGTPANVKGYYYLCESVRLVMESPDHLKPITKKLYPAIAQKYGSTPERVERCIRHAIKIAWQRGRVEQLNSLLGCSILSQADQPSNGELIALIAKKLEQRVCTFDGSSV